MRWVKSRDLQVSGSGVAEAGKSESIAKPWSSLVRFESNSRIEAYLFLVSKDKCEEECNYRIKHEHWIGYVSLSFISTKTRRSCWLTSGRPKWKLNIKG